MIVEFKTLLDILQKQRDLYVELLRVMAEAHEPLVNYRAAKIDEYNKMIETIQMKADALEKARLNIIRRIQEAAPMVTPSMNLTALAAVSPPPFGDELLRIKPQLEILIRNIKLQNEKNTKVAHAALAVVSGLGRLLNQLCNTPLTYQPFATRKPAFASARSA
jgi:hypothetical protein